MILPVKDFRPLPKNWSASPPPVGLQRIGDEWVSSLALAVLEVPTAIVLLEQNCLLNPAHPDFAQIKLEKPRRFRFDQRLLKASLET